DYLEGELGELLTIASRRRPATVLLIRTHFSVRDKHVDGNIFLVFESASFDSLLVSIDRMLAA
ncbi:MAG TPA: hypothetical protein VNX25_07770, partial [Verrucomicrobiae bacterium]|nr:hypothetical protein [Verrucomicrobiae bacterium]